MRIFVLWYLFQTSSALLSIFLSSNFFSCQTFLNSQLSWFPLLKTKLSLFSLHFSVLHSLCLCTCTQVCVYEKERVCVRVCMGKRECVWMEKEFARRRSRGSSHRVSISEESNRRNAAPPRRVTTGRTHITRPEGLKGGNYRQFCFEGVRACVWERSGGEFDTEKRERYCFKRRGS